MTMSLNDELGRIAARLRGRHVTPPPIPLPQAIAADSNDLDALRERQLAEDPTRRMIHAFQDQGQRASWLAALRYVRNLPE